MKSLFQRKLASAQSAVTGPDPNFVINDKLTEVDVLPHRIGQSGFPEASDFLAYSSIQRILAVSTADGQLQLYGRQGCVRTVQAGPAEATADLQFATNRGVLLRLLRGGTFQVWSLDTCKVVATLRNDADPICSFSVLAQDPYIVLGCKSGSLRVLCLLDKDGEPVCHVKPTHNIRAQPYVVSAEQLGAHGAIASLSTISSTRDDHFVLVTHEDHSIRVWNLRDECVVCLASPEGEQALMLAGPAVSSCWIGDDALMFATGHQCGYVLIWGMVPTLQDPHGQPPPPNLLMKIRAIPEGRSASPIRKLFPFGSSSEQLLVLGGQAPDEPELLTLFSLSNAKGITDLDSPPTVETSGQSLHWFGPIQGAALVGDQSSIADAAEPVAILVLTEGGNLMLHDLSNFIPVPMELSFQGMSPVVTSHWCEAWQGKSNVHSLTSQAYRNACAARLANEGSGQWSWVVSGGSLPDLSRTTSDFLYFTGHRDGGICVWDMVSQTPFLLFHLPHMSGGRVAVPQQIQACGAAGLVCVLRGQATIDLYQFCSTQRNVNCATWDDNNKVTLTAEAQPAGFQKILQWRSSNGCKILSFVLSSRHRLIIVGDDGGFVTFIDISKPCAVEPVATGLTTVAQMSLAYTIITEGSTGNAKRRSTERASGGGSIRLCLYVTAADSSMAAIDAENRIPLGKPLKPKTLSSPALHIAALDLEAVPTTVAQRYIALPWTTAPNEEATEDVEGQPEEVEAEGEQAAEPQEGELETEHILESEPVKSIPSSTEAEAMRSQSVASAGDSDDGSLTTARRSRSAPQEEDRLTIQARNSSVGLPPTAFASALSEGNAVPVPDHQVQQLPPATETSLPPAGSNPMRKTDTGKKERVAALHSYYAEAADGDTSTHGPGALSPFASANLEDVLDDETIPTMVAYVLCVTGSYARTYYVDNVKNGERSAISKAQFDDTAMFASTFDSRNGPGLVIVTRKGVLQVFSLPALVPLLSNSLDVYLGSSWTTSHDSSWMQDLQSAVLSPNGQLAIFGPFQEFARIALAEDAAQPVNVHSFVDWDQEAAVQAAAAATAAAQRQPQTLRPKQELPKPVCKEEAPPAEARPRPPAEARPRPPAEAPPAGARNNLRQNSQKKGFTGFLTSVVGKVVDEGTKVVGKVVDEGTRVAGKITDGVTGKVTDGVEFLSTLSSGRDAGPQRKTLKEVFSQAPPPVPEPIATASSSGATGIHSGNRQELAGSLSSPIAKNTANRQELLGGRIDPALSAPVDRERIAQAAKAAGSDGQPRQRTAEEIKQAYGIKTKKTATLQGVMAENQDLLAQRGEKLNKIAERTAALQNEAMSFAATAKKMAEQETNKKWWQL